MFLSFFQTTTLRFLIAFLMAASFFIYDHVEAADLIIAPATGNYSTGQTFTVAVRVAPSGSSVNAVEAEMSFDSQVLNVVSVSRDGSIFTLWTTEPTFSNTAGTIRFGGGSPTPFTAQSNLVSVTFRTVGPGTGALRVTNASVLAADGLGTDVFRTGGQASFTVAAGAPPPPPPVAPPTSTPTPTPTNNSDENDTDAIIFGDPPRAPEIGSQVFLDSEVWYQATEGLFSWTLPFDVTEVALEIATSADNVPHDNEDAIFDPAIDEFRITRDIITDGVQYFSVSFRNQVGWGAVLNRKLMIDTTPPENFTVEVRASNSPTGFPTINFAATDVTSGIAYYDMYIADREPVRITPDQAALGYLLQELTDGTYTVRVVAFDQAGNERESSAAVLITAGWVAPVAEDETRSWRDFFTAYSISVTLLLLMIVGLLAYIWYDKQQMKQREEKLRRETREIQDQMEKIFSALRDEIYDQINTITKRKRLSQGEKEAVDGLHQALEVSETLIEKEINDVRTILK